MTGIETIIQYCGGSHGVRRHHRHARGVQCRSLDVPVAPAGAAAVSAGASQMVPGELRMNSHTGGSTRFLPACNYGLAILDSRPAGRLHSARSSALFRGQSHSPGQSLPRLNRTVPRGAFRFQSPAAVPSFAPSALWAPTHRLQPRGRVVPASILKRCDDDSTWTNL